MEQQNPTKPLFSFFPFGYFFSCICLMAVYHIMRDLGVIHSEKAEELQNKKDCPCRFLAYIYLSQCFHYELKIIQRFCCYIQHRYMVETWMYSKMLSFKDTLFNNNGSIFFSWPFLPLCFTFFGHKIAGMYCLHCKELIFGEFCGSKTQ